LLQRTLILELMVGLPIMLMWVNCFPILSFAGLNPDVTRVNCYVKENQKSEREKEREREKEERERKERERERERKRTP